MEKEMFKKIGVSGFCIACRRRIPLNSFEPYCSVCYGNYKNSGIGFYCHICGIGGHVSFTNPTCHRCYVRRVDCKIIKENKVSGFCIGCGEKIELNPQKPYCLACYKEYIGWGIGFYCHICGGDGGGQIHSERLVCRACTEEMGKTLKKRTTTPHLTF